MKLELDRTVLVLNSGVKNNLARACGLSAGKFFLVHSPALSRNSYLPKRHQRKLA